MKLQVNGELHDIDVEPEMPLLWVLRDELGITGPKYGCGMGICGACTVHIGGAAVRSCVLPVGSVQAPVVTIEGLGTPPGRSQGGPAPSGGSERSERGGLGQPDALHAVQKAWIEQQVAQCGYCQSGQIMAAAAFLAATPSPSDAQIDEAMSANLCRCGTYPRIRSAVKAAAAAMSKA
jgi:isoquinoline 1-oxidoreductase subunit alpha